MFLITLMPIFYHVVFHYFWIIFYILYQMKIILQRYSQVCVCQGPSAEHMTHLKTQVYTTEKIHWDCIFKMDIAEKNGNL